MTADNHVATGGNKTTPASPLAIEKASWIWTNDDPGESHLWIDARKQLEVHDPKAAWIDITADLRYFLWINGKAVGFGPPKFHWETPTVDRYAIGRWLVEGDNVVAVRVYSYGAGWDISSCMPKRGALRAMIGVDGHHIPTDRSWEVRRERAYSAKTVRRGEFQPPAELFDARKAFPPPWHEDSGDSGWQPAVELGEISADVRFEMRDIPLFNWTEHAPDRVIETGVAVFPAPLDREEMKDSASHISTASRFPSQDGCAKICPGIGGAANRVVLDASSLPVTEGAYALWDFGRLWTGYPVITLSGTPGTVVDLSYAECLMQGHLDPTKHGLNYTDRLILGEGSLTHRITWPKCFRYLQVDVRGGDAVVESLILERSAYPVERKGTFRCSDPALEQAWEISAHTVELCMEDGYMDTPWRERGSWLGDDIPKMLANYSIFGDNALARRFLLHHVRGQLPSGQMEGKYPGCVPSFISTWTLTFPVTVKEYLRHSGDSAFAKEMLPAIGRSVAWMENHRLPEGVYGNLPLEVTAKRNVYNFIDWAPVDTSGANAAWNAHAYACLRSAVFVARTAGDENKAGLWEKRADELRAAFLRLFWDEERGVFSNGWRDGKRLARWGGQENYLAVLTGMADDSRRKRILARLKNEDLLAIFKPENGKYDEIIPGSDGNHMVAIALNLYRWDERKMVPLGTPYFAWFALEALLESGMADEALAMIGQHWGEFSRQGATSTWETWDRDRGSLSHAYGCAPAIVLGKYILGVRLSNNLDADVEIFPQSGGLEWARGRVTTPKGVVQVNWNRKGNVWRMEVDAPKGCRVLAGLPCGQENEKLLIDGKKEIDVLSVRRYSKNYAAIRSRGTRFVLETMVEKISHKPRRMEVSSISSYGT